MIRRRLGIKLPCYILACAIPDVDSHGCRGDTIDDDVSGVCNRKPALATPGGGYADFGELQDQVERVLDTRLEKRSGARVFVRYVSKGINVRLQRTRRPIKPPDAACGHWRH